MRWRIPAGVLVALALACAPPERPAGTKGEGSSDVPVEGGHLVRRLEGDAGTLNFVMHSTQPEKLVLSYLHDALVEVNRNLEVIPGLARSWTVSDDRLTWVFELEPAATFSDGRPVRAQDVVFTLRRIVDPKSQSVQLSGLFAGLKLDQTRALDDHTVQVVFTQARPAQLLAFNIAVLPEHVYSKGDFASSFHDRAIGSGPYEMVRRVRGSEILLERRENYWREKPYIESILFRIIEDRNQAWNALRAGEIDETIATSDQWLANREDPSFTSTIEFHRFYELGYNFIPWNNRDPILADPAIRRALTMCLDRRLIIEKLYYGTARIITGPFTPNHWAFNPSVSPIEFDPTAAGKVFAAAGWSDSDRDGVLDREGEPFEIEMLLVAGDTSSANQAQIYQDQLARAGVRLRITQLDAATLFSRVLSGEFQSTMLAWSLDLDPDLFSLFHSSQFPPNGQNFVYYDNPEVDRLIEVGRTEFDRNRRAEIYRELHEILARDQPYAWTIQVSTKWAVNRRVRGVEHAEGLGLFGWSPGPLQWWIAPEDRGSESERREP
ncbi:MAG TPA: ABC transporter substrate-binding protein [Thermoanaerobaculia bacterium]|nr:ABC transporter substrate-binding protein [Thermoanaerobaculia bacterium]